MNGNSVDLHDITLTMSGGNTIVLTDKTLDEARRIVLMILLSWNDPSAPGSLTVSGAGPSDGRTMAVNLRQIADLRTDVDLP
jgi:ABC-type arginine transport system ATPase subunit